MDTEDLKRIGRELAAGRLNLEQTLAALTDAMTARTDDAVVDLDRSRRCGFPEVIFGEGKSPETIAEIAVQLRGAGHPVLATRVDAEKALTLSQRFEDARYNEIARCFRIGDPVDASIAGRVAVVTAGSSDRPVAEESLETLRWMGVEPLVIQDIGVAGPQRLLARVSELRRQDAIIVVAGMEGALPSVVGGHVNCPVIAVPTSVGYGASFSGLAALLGMLNSCASNVTVVNIDAGFKAGYVAGLIAKRIPKS